MAINLHKQVKVAANESAPNSAMLQTDQVKEEAEALLGAAGPKKKKKKAVKLIIFLVVVVAIVAVAIQFLNMGGQQNDSASAYTTATVERRDITETLSGSGTLEPADSYTVTTLNEGEVLTADFEEGDIVEKDTVLYSIDSSDTSASIERAEITLSEAQTTYQRKLESQDDLNVKASAAGYVTDVAVEVGDSVTAGQTIATVIDSASMTIVLPFPSNDAANFYVGQSAAVTLDGSFETLTGTITKISGTDTILTGNIMVKQVTIEVQNPGALSDTQEATAKIGDTSCSASGTFTYKNEATITASVSGEVSKINVSEGNWTSKNQIIVTLKSDTLTDEIQNAYNSVRDAEISLNSQKDQMDSYTITSPIYGTVIEKNYKAGDTIETGKTLCTIYDLTYLTVTMNVDELDIGNIEVGQSVSITADAVSGKTFEGTVTKINIMGTTSGGVTTYPVTVRIDETEGLLPGMNVNGEIVIAQRENVLTVPSAAVLRGDQVLVQLASGSSETTESDIPEGFGYVDVVTGSSDEDFVEITEGLSEGDVITYIEPTAVGSSVVESMMAAQGADNQTSDSSTFGAPAMSGGASGMGG